MNTEKITTSQTRLATIENARATLRNIHARWSANRRWRTARNPASVVISQSSPSMVFATRWFGPYRVIGAITITHNAAGTVTTT